MWGVERAVLIDGSSFIYRAYYAIPGYLCNSKGLPTKAIFGVTQMLLKILKEWQPEIIIWFMDEKGPTFRHLQYRDYKATRPEMPDDLKIQIPYIKKIVVSLGIPVVSQEGLEADDLISAFIQRFSIPAIIVAPDRDLFSLIDERVVAYDPIRETFLDLKTFEEKYGFHPKSFPYYRALVGDPSDNIKGVPGIGEKTAKDLVHKFRTLENIFENINQIPSPKIREALKTYKDQIYQNLELIKLKQDSPLPSEDLEYYKKKDCNYQEIKALFKELEFRKFLKEFSLPEEPYKIEFLEFSPSELEEFLEKKDFSSLGLSLEALTPSLFKSLFNLYIAFSPDKIISVEYNSQLLSLLKKKKVYLYDYKKFLHTVKGSLGNPYDVKILAYLLNPSLKNYELSNLLVEFLDFYYGNKISPKEKAVFLFLLGKKLEEKVKEEGLEEWFQKVEMPLSEVLYSMENWGIKIDLEYVRELNNKFSQKIKELEEKLYKLAGTVFNPRSSQEVGKILFEKLKLPKIKKTQKVGQPSTDSEVLEELSHLHPLVPLLLEYRGFYKLKSTYLEVFLREVSPKTGRLHTEFNPTGTATGRLSSQKPNLQNIPVKGEEGLAIRRAFVAEEGWCILTLDYSQIELRILAHFSQEENLLEAFAKDEDIHSYTGCEVFGVSPEKVTPEMRRVAKVINFGIAYGMSPYGLSKELKIDPSSAEAYIRKYFNRYPKVKEYIEKTIEEAKDKGYVQTIAGRKRYIPEIFSQNRTIRELGQRMAINTPIQGSAADLIKAAMVALYKKLLEKGFRSRIILQVHDELLIESPEEEVKEVLTLAKDIMEKPFEALGIPVKLSVPIKVKTAFGKSWGEVKE